MTFSSLGLSDSIVKAVHNQGYKEPSPIQTKAIPLILEGKDVLASAQTGTGKTAGFTLPLLEILSKTPQGKNRPIRALVLTPTRELAAQVFDNVRAYSQHVDIRSAVIFGGVKQNPQVATLRRGVDVLVATPGRLLDLQNQKLLALNKIEILVLDEADRMLDMGFKRDIDKIMALMPSRRQNLLFSATFSKEIKSLANAILHHPVQVETASQNSTVDVISQRVLHCDKDKKTDLIIKLIDEGNWNQVLVFTRTKHGADKLCKKMVKASITAAAIHGNKSQNARTKALKGFKSNEIRVLVATDIAARGIDIPLLPYVINFELPNIPEDYVHRIGRTGRAGASGEAISLVSPDETTYLRDIKKLIAIDLPSEHPVGFEPDPNASTEPPKQGQRQSRNKSPKRNQPSKSKDNKQDSSKPSSKKGPRDFKKKRKGGNSTQSTEGRSQSQNEGQDAGKKFNKNKGKKKFQPQRGNNSKSNRDTLKGGPDDLSY